MSEPWQFREIDSSLFKAFVYAAKELNFTKAARRAAMTQSGISQKILKLESQVGQPLFVRLNRSVILTEAGQMLLDYIERQQDELEKFFELTGKGVRTMAGPVRYGMPHSCLFTPHFSMLLATRQEKFDRISLKVELCPNEEVVEKVLRRDLDFGFVTTRLENSAIERVSMSVEEYALVGRKGQRGLKPTADFIRQLPFVNYPGLRNLFEVWKGTHFVGHRSLSFEVLSFSGEINSLHGAVTMIRNGVGWSIMPIHVVEGPLKAGGIQIFPGTERKKVKSEIDIISLKGVRQPARVRLVMDTFLSLKR